MPIIRLNTENMQTYIQSQKPVVVTFSAPWCTYCRRLAPALEAAAEEFCDTLNFGLVNIDEEPELAQAEQIEVVPTLLLYRGGQLLGSIVAPHSKSQLTEFIEESLQQRRRESSAARHVYDMIIVGGGPGGYTAALYAARAGLDAVVLEQLSAGGQMALTQRIDNYPGFEDGVDGFLLGEKMKLGAERFGVETKLVQALGADLAGGVKRVRTTQGDFYARSVVLACGAVAKELGVADEQALIGKGVSYCAACDGMFYKDRTVVVAGGGNSAAANALLLSRICKKVILVHRRDALRATRIYHEPLMKAENVSFVWDSQIVELLHEQAVTGVRLENVKTHRQSTLACDGVFVSIGRQPATQWLDGQLETDPAGYIVADESTRTSVDGVFAVGDVRTKALRQVVTAAADGAVAVHYAEEYLSQEG